MMNAADSETLPPPTAGIDDADLLTVPGAEATPITGVLEGPLQKLVVSGQLNTLELDQKRLLAAFLEDGFSSQAHDNSRVSKARHYRWLRTNPVYAEACKALGEGVLMETAVRLDNLLPKAAGALEDALDAEKYVRVTCPCGCDHSFRVPIADLKLRVDVAKSVLNRSGEMGTIRHKVEGKIEHEGTVTTMSLEDRVALRQIERGMPVPAQIVESLRQRGLLLAGPRDDGGSEDRYSPPGQDATALEGEWRPVPSEH